MDFLSFLFYYYTHIILLHDSPVARLVVMSLKMCLIFLLCYYPIEIEALQQPQLYISWGLAASTTIMKFMVGVSIINPQAGLSGLAIATSIR